MAAARKESAGAHARHSLLAVATQLAPERNAFGAVGSSVPRVNWDFWKMLRPERRAAPAHVPQADGLAADCSRGSQSGTAYIFFAGAKVNGRPGNETAARCPFRAGACTPSTKTYILPFIMGIRRNGWLNVLSRAVLCAPMLVACCVEYGLAQPVSFPEPADPLPKRESVTYLDLVRLVVPGITVEGRTYSGGQPIAVRHLDGMAEDIEIKPTGYLQIAAVPVRSGGADRMALLLHFDKAEDSATGFAPLALFDVGGEPGLLDVVDVAFERSTSFLDPVRLSVSAGNDVLIIYGTHTNTGQHYMIAAIVLVRDDRFELIDEISTFTEKTCAYDRTQQLDVRQAGGKPFADVVATVTELTAISGEDCGSQTAPEPGTRKITVTYRWDGAAQRYVPDSDAFAVLARENEERF